MASHPLLKEKQTKVAPRKSVSLHMQLPQEQLLSDLGAGS